MCTLVGLMGISPSEKFGVLQNGGSKSPSYGVAIECTATGTATLKVFYFLSFLRKREFGLNKPKTKIERKKTAYINAVLVVAEVGPRLRTRQIWSLLVVTSFISLQTTFVYAYAKSDLSLIPLLLLSPKRLSPFRGPRCRFESK